MSKNIRKEAIIYFINQLCRNDNRFSLRSCLSELKEKKRVKISLGTLSNYLKEYNIAYEDEKWNFSKQIDYKFKRKELENYVFPDLLSLEEILSNDIEEKTFTTNNSNDKNPFPVNELVELKKKIDLLFDVVNSRLTVISNDVEVLKSINLEIVSSKEKVITSGKVTLENYRTIADKLRDENFEAGYPSRTIVTSFRTTALLREQYEKFDSLHRLDNSDLFAALLSSFIEEQYDKEVKKDTIT